jgi:hypothetical protein
MSDNSRLQPTYGATDNLHSDDVAPGDCIKGEVTFEVPVGQQPTAVLFDYSGVGHGRWTMGP